MVELLTYVRAFVIYLNTSLWNPSSVNIFSEIEVVTMLVSFWWFLSSNFSVNYEVTIFVLSSSQKSLVIVSKVWRHLKTCFNQLRFIFRPKIFDDWNAYRSVASMVWSVVINIRALLVFTISSFWKRIVNLRDNFEKLQSF